MKGDETRAVGSFHRLPPEALFGPFIDDLGYPLSGASARDLPDQAFSVALHVVDPVDALAQRRRRRPLIAGHADRHSDIDRNLDRESSAQARIDAGRERSPTGGGRPFSNHVDRSRAGLQRLASD